MEPNCRNRPSAPKTYITCCLILAEKDKESPVAADDKANQPESPSLDTRKCLLLISVTALVSFHFLVVTTVIVEIGTARTARVLTKRKKKKTKNKKLPRSDFQSEAQKLVIYTPDDIIFLYTLSFLHFRPCFSSRQRWAFNSSERDKCAYPIRMPRQADAEKAALEEANLKKQKYHPCIHGVYNTKASS